MPAGATYEPIATTTLGSDTSDITFSSIPGTYTDLKLVCTGRTTRAGANVDTLGIRLNSDTGTNYSITAMAGSGSSAYSFRQSNMTYWYLDYQPAALAPTNAVGTIIVNLFSYAGSTNKTALIMESVEVNDASYAKVSPSVQLWRSTSAITSIKLYSTTSSNLKAGYTATLYGIAKA